MTPDSEFLKRLLKTFAIEAKEHIDTLTEGLLELNKDHSKSDDRELIESLFRETHSLKGAARSVNIVEIEELCKAMEEVFNFYKKETKPFRVELVDGMLEGCDLLSKLKDADEEQRRALKPEVQSSIEKILQEHANYTNVPLKKPSIKVEPVAKPSVLESQQLQVKEEKSEEKSAEVSKENTSNETLRISLQKLNSMLLQSEEMLYAKIVAKRHYSMLEEMEQKLTTILKGIDLSKESYIELKQLSKEFALNKKRAFEESYEISLMVDNLHESMKSVLMLPFQTIYHNLPKTVYDMAKSVGKEARLEMIGAEIEMDRRVLEEMHDPIIHILRNAVDHGIESKEKREKLGKDSVGKITLKFEQKESSKIELIIEDDGGGIDLQALEKKAAQSVNYSSKKLVDSIFESGITTAKRVNDLSGRGLGLAIVKEKTQKLGGDVRVDSFEGKGVKMTLSLPMSMATFRGVVCRVGEEFYVFPSQRVSRALALSVEELKSVEGQLALSYEEHVIPFHMLHAILEHPVDISELSELFVIVLEMGKEKIAIGVDKILFEEEIILKGIGSQLQRVKNISGAAMIGASQAALVINVVDIFQSFKATISSTPRHTKAQESIANAIMIVDDSPTTRALLQNILEIAGYSVTSASDGVEAMQKLKEQRIDLVVSDVDMPHMNGIELTKSIRSTKEFEELPIILVTSLESSEDKQQGMEAGADAYIVKSTFDQNNLLEKIAWLI